MPSSFKEGLIAPQLTIIKGKETVLPKQLVWMSEDGVRTNVDVAYTMESVEGVRLDDANKKLMVETSCEASAIELTAATGRGMITFSCKVYADDNKITLKFIITELTATMKAGMSGAGELEQAVQVMNLQMRTMRRLSP